MARSSMSGLPLKKRVQKKIMRAQDVGKTSRFLGDEVHG